MTDEQKQKLTAMRSQGYGYKRIGQALGISANSVKSYCRRNECKKQNMDKPSANRTTTNNQNVCLFCGVPVTSTPGKKTKKFCSDSCRMKWWNSHPELISHRASRMLSCNYCGKAFPVYGNSNRKYCCHSCYVEDRFGGAFHG